MGEKSVQRSFRLSAETSDLLDRSALLLNESRNALVERLLSEALRAEQHPLVRFRTGAAGRREPVLVGTRVLVRQVVAQVKDDGDIDAVADYLGIAPVLVRAAVSYYVEHSAEVDADQEWADLVENAERARWEREQVAIA